MTQPHATGFYQPNPEKGHIMWWATHETVMINFEPDNELLLVVSDQEPHPGDWGELCAILADLGTPALSTCEMSVIPGAEEADCWEVPFDLGEYVLNRVLNPVP
jgi:hypothetical protein